jgi:mannose-1-phosphate guanylyltransferase
MYRNGNPWALVLAAGDGSRLRDFTQTASGLTVPKQFCSLRGGPSLLQEALHRALAVAPIERLCTVVAAQHLTWWADSLRTLPTANVIVQSENRGTANGILLPLLHILERDPDASLVIVPSDHHVRDERTLARALRYAAEQLTWRLEEILILGIEPEEADPELGYIEPGESDGRGSRHVRRFVEKPNSLLAGDLIERGALWNAFIVAARAQALLAIYRRRCPEVVREMYAAIERDRQDRKAAATQSLYECLPSLDFSRHLLEQETSSLRVLPVPQCGWSDLGTPARLARVLRRLPREEAPKDATVFTPVAYLNLAAQHQRLCAAGY